MVNIRRIIVLAWLMPMMLSATTLAAEVFVRFKVLEPVEGAFTIKVGGFRHAEPWYLPSATVAAGAQEWSQWLDASDWPWHGRLSRAGGIAEWPTMTAKVSRSGERPAAQGCALEVQLADAPDPSAVVHQFVETSESGTIGFLVPTPLRDHADEFETGSQMTARHHSWAQDAVARHPVKLDQLTFITAMWGHYDPALARQSIETLKLLGFNIIGNVNPQLLREAGVPTYNQTRIYQPDPDTAAKAWLQHVDQQLNNQLRTEDGRWRTQNATHYVLSDEVTTLDFRGVDKGKRDQWFREFLQARGVTAAELNLPIEQVEYPAAAMHETTLPRDADLPTRRLMYYAAKFGHWWSARQLRHSSDLIRSTLPGMKTETLPSDHGFFYAWGAPHLGMSYRMLDLFELGAQRSVDQLSAEDWLGLNHMYGPEYTWTGAQSFAYFNAICRSAIQHAPGDEPMMLRSLITVSDDAYLRLKAYSVLGQGSKSFFFWTFGPTYISTENYWSDLRSQYDGIVKFGRALQQAEPLLHSARPVRDPVAILYSVSHDLWHSDNPAAFVEKRLTWHALRHLHVQPSFLREEDVEAGRLNAYKVLYVTDWCISRAASEAIDQWVRDGGVVYLSAAAATRDEFYQPYIPPFAAALWPDNAAAQLIAQSHAYNERTDLPHIAPISTATVQLEATDPFELPVIGCRLNLREDIASPVARFADSAPAAAVARHGGGQVFACGFLPMLAYAQGANFKPLTLEEKWPAPPRSLIQQPLCAAGVVPVARADVPVVETSLLRDEARAALVLVNYTYEPINLLTVHLTLDAPLKGAVSTEGAQVQWETTPDGIRLRLPLAWTDIVVLE